MAQPCLVGLPLLRKGDYLTDYFFWIRMTPALLDFYVKTGEAVEALYDTVRTAGEKVRTESGEPFIADPRVELMEGFGSFRAEDPMDHEITIIKRGLRGKKRAKLGLHDERLNVICATGEEQYEKMEDLIEESNKKHEDQIAATALVIDPVPTAGSLLLTYRWDVEIAKGKSRKVYYSLDIDLDRLRAIAGQIGLVQSAPRTTPLRRTVPPPPPRRAASGRTL